MSDNTKQTLGVAPQIESAIGNPGYVVTGIKLDGSLQFGQGAGNSANGLSGPNLQNANYTFALSDMGAGVEHNDSSSAYTWTVPPISTANWPTTYIPTIKGFNLSSGTLLIQPYSGVTLTSGGVSGSVTIAANSTFILSMVSADRWVLESGGITSSLLTGLGGPTTKNTNYTFTSTDVGVLFRHTDSSAYTWTIDTYANAPIAAGQIICGTCESTGTLTVAAPSGGTLIRLDGTAGTGNRTIGAASEFVLKKLDNANAWAISGAALS